jgi:hypothetical protein
MQETYLVLGFLVAVGLQILRIIEQQPRESAAELGGVDAESPLAHQSGASSAGPVISPTAQE